MAHEITDAQRERLTQPLDPKRVHLLERGGSEFPYLKAAEVVAHANAIFGVAGWSTRLVGPPRPIGSGQDRSGKAWEVWMAVAEVQVGDATFGDAGTCVRWGGGPDGLEMAAKGAASDAVKRALRYAGEQFGLSLYTHEENEIVAAWRAFVGSGATDDQVDGASRPAAPAAPAAGDAEKRDYPALWRDLNTALAKAKFTARGRSYAITGRDLAALPEWPGDAFNLATMIEWARAHPGQSPADLVALAIHERRRAVEEAA